jgi:chemotaxis signal transduction protein
MMAMVRFRAGGASYAIPVDDVRQVRAADDLAGLPSGRAGVAGLIKQEGEALPVLSVLGPSGRRLLVVEAGGRRFGLLVEEVSGVAQVDERSLGPPPEGQDERSGGALVTGVLDAGEELVLVVDAAGLARRGLGLSLP